MAQCANATGIPLSVLKLAKKSGCEAFKDSNVRLLPLLKYLFAQEKDSQINWKELSTKLDVRLKEIKIAESEKTLLPADEVHSAIAKGTAAFFQELGREFLQLPAALRGLEEREMVQILGKSESKITEAIRKHLQAYADQPKEKK